jgi:hypothetical protein
MLNVVMLSVIMLNVVMRSGEAPFSADTVWRQYNQHNVNWPNSTKHT